MEDGEEGLIITSDLPRWKMEEESLIIPGDLPG